MIGLTKVLKDALEANISQAIEPNMLVMTFTVNRAATISNKFSMAQDQTTPVENKRRNTANCEIAEFGEKIFFQPMTKCSKTNEPDVRWQYGLLMRVSTRTNEIMVS